MRILLALVAVATLVSAPIVLALAETPNHIPGGNTDTKADISDLNLQYLTTVNHMNSINQQEAQTIKTGIITKVTATMNSNYNCQIGTDYVISNIDSLVAGADLGAVTITITSTTTSTKIEGTSDIIISVKENINDRVLDQPIEIPADQANSLTQLTATLTVNTIRQKVNEILNASQTNVEGTDYNFVNLDLIVAGAQYSTYQNAVFVKAIDSSANLTGQFQITFQLV